MSRLIYLDNAATTKTAPEVVDAMIPYFTEHYGNPSSVYSFASGNKEVVSRQREIIAQALGAQANEIYFTAGGSESLQIMRSERSSRSGKLERLHRNTRFCSIQMQYRHLARYRLMWMPVILICSAQADISSTDRKESDFYISAKESRSDPLYTEVHRRESAVPEQKTCLVLLEWGQLWSVRCGQWKQEPQKSENSEIT